MKLQVLIYIYISICSQLLSCVSRLVADPASAFWGLGFRKNRMHEQLAARDVPNHRPLAQRRPKSRMSPQEGANIGKRPRLDSLPSITSVSYLKKQFPPILVASVYSYNQRISSPLNHHQHVRFGWQDNANIWMDKWIEGTLLKPSLEEQAGSFLGLGFKGIGLRVYDLVCYGSGLRA